MSFFSSMVSCSCFSFLFFLAKVEETDVPRSKISPDSVFPFVFPVFRDGDDLLVSRIKKNLDNMVQHTINVLFTLLRPDIWMCEN